MSAKQLLDKLLLNKLIIATIILGGSSALTTAAIAQSFLYPSASFFTPFAAPYESEDGDLATILEQYPTFNQKLEEAGLWETIQQQESLTVLVPSEAAFEALIPEAKEKLANPKTLKQVLQYHLVRGTINEADIKRRAVATQLEKSSVTITGVPEGDKINVKLNEAAASEPIAATDGGVIIPIDRVLIPPGL